MPPLRLPSRLAFPISSRTIHTTPALHAKARVFLAPEPLPRIPPPIPFVPDVPTFFKLIGRGLSQHASKFPSWESLFSLTSPQLKEIGIEPPRTRRYLLQRLHDFRRGRHGLGGDFRHVSPNGAAAIKVLEVPRGPLRTARVVVNVPAGAKPERLDPEEVVRVSGFTPVGTKLVRGPYAVPAPKGDGAVVAATEGMWENKRGRKIDGGERRRDEVRFKRRVAERKALRESQGFY